MPGFTSRPVPHVALIVETSTHYGRELLAGITTYLREHRRWSVFLEQLELDSPPPAWLKTWDGDGAIVRTTHPTLVEHLAARGVPAVDLSDRGPPVGLPRVNSDDWLIGRMAADHLLERGYRQFAFCGFAGELWSDRRREGFAARLRSAGLGHEVHATLWRGRAWEAEQDRTAEWLATLPGPLGVLAANDLRGQQVLDACRRAGLAVPEQVGVVGCDDDHLLCGLCDPPLSSVRPDTVRVGYLAAERVAALMAGGDPSPTVLYVPPLDVAARPSTDALVVDDQDTSAAARYIREHACDGLTVSDIVRLTGLSRSELERRFRRHLGRTPHEEINRVRLARICQLLTETNLKVGQIAERTGFVHPEYLCVFFKRITGKTPESYRIEAGTGRGKVRTTAGKKTQ